MAGFDSLKLLADVRYIFAQPPQQALEAGYDQVSLPTYGDWQTESGQVQREESLSEASRISLVFNTAFNQLPAATLVVPAAQIPAGAWELVSRHTNTNQSVGQSVELRNGTADPALFSLPDGGDQFDTGGNRALLYRDRLWLFQPVGSFVATGEDLTITVRGPVVHGARLVINQLALIRPGSVFTLRLHDPVQDTQREVSRYLPVAQAAQYVQPPILGSDGSAYFAGWMADVSYYQRALSQEDLSLLQENLPTTDEYVVRYFWPLQTHLLDLAANTQAVGTDITHGR